MSPRRIRRRSVVAPFVVLLTACSSAGDSSLTAPTDLALGKGRTAGATAPA